MKAFFFVALAMVVVFLIAGVLQMTPVDEQMTEEETYKELSKDLSGLQELLNSPIPMWQCGNPPTLVPKREDYPDIKEFHMAVAGFRAQSYAWMVCATEYVYVYPLVIDDWGKQLIKENEVIIQ